MAKDIHKSAFEESTIAKLAIFRDYLKLWLPVFIASKKVYWKNINLFDFFSGPGQDAIGNMGSPMIMIEELLPHLDLVKEKNLNVSLFFNEGDKQKFDELSNRLETEVKENCFNRHLKNEDFKLAFDNWYNQMNNKDSANLLFLDQYGVKHITEEIFGKIINLKHTDFLFFISSSTIKRFADHPSIQNYFKVNKTEVDNIPYHQIHRYVLNYYRTLIPTNKEYYLSSFSLRKGSNIYGLIFGSNHPLGMEKFLTTCWKIDSERGEANFDIDNEKIDYQQYDMFAGDSGIRRPNKIEVFEKDLEEAIKTKELVNVKDVYLYTLINGFLPKHSKPVLQKLVTSNVLKKGNYNLSSDLCKRNAVVASLIYH